LCFDVCDEEVSFEKLAMEFDQFEDFVDALHFEVEDGGHCYD
jgi:hypothetical protein